MPKKKPEVATAKKRGGADSIREKGLVQLAFPLTADEREAVHRAAGLAGKKTNAWLRELALAAIPAAVWDALRK